MLTRPIARVAFAAFVVLAPFWPAVAAATNNTGTTTTTTTTEVTTTTGPPETSTSTTVVEETTTTAPAETTTTTVPAETTTSTTATTVECDGDRCTPPVSTVPECDRGICPPPAPPGVPQGCQSDRPELCAPQTTVPPCPAGMFPSTSAGDLPCLPEDPCTTSGFTVWHFQPCTIEQNQPPATTTTTVPAGVRMLPETGREIETILIIGLILTAVGALVVWACSRQFDEGEWQ